MIDENRVDAFLAHHGVKGMKWGVINDENPIGRDGLLKTKLSTFVSTKVDAHREGRAKEFEIQAAVIDTKIKKLKNKIEPKSKITQQGRALELKRLETVKKRNLNDAEKVRMGSLTSGQKKALIGAGVVAGLLVAYGAYSMSNNGDLNRAILKGKALLPGNDGPLKKNPLLLTYKTPDSVFEHIVSKVNPGYAEKIPGTKLNCRRSTFAYEMRRRGYDVAATKTNTGTGQNVYGLYNSMNERQLPTSIPGNILGMVTNPYNSNDIKASIPTKKLSFDGFENNGLRKAQSVFHALGMQPEGARGELRVKWTVGSSNHSMAWEIFKGKPVIFDAQTGDRYDTPELIQKWAKYFANADYTRLDNLDLNEDFLLRWVKNV